MTFKDGGFCDGKFLQKWFSPIYNELHVKICDNNTCFMLRHHLFENSETLSVIREKIIIAVNLTMQCQPGCTFGLSPLKKFFLDLTSYHLTQFCIAINDLAWLGMTFYDLAWLWMTFYEAWHVTWSCFHKWKHEFSLYIFSCRVLI